MNDFFKQDPSNLFLSLEVSENVETSFLNHFNIESILTNNNNLIFDSCNILARTSLNNANLIMFLSFLKNSTFQIYKKHIKNSFIINNTVKRLASKDYIQTQDNKRVFECLANTAEDFSQWATDFIKDLPGFNLFSSQDLLLIVKKSMWNLYSLQNSVFYKDDENYTILKENVQFTKSNMVKLFGSFRTHLIFNIHKYYNKLELNEYETALFHAFILTSISGKFFIKDNLN